MGCNSNFVYDLTLKKCVCPEDLPNNDGSKCLSCNEGTYWKQDENKCVRFCSENLVYDSGRKICLCPASAPYKQNNRCIAC